MAENQKDRYIQYLAEQNQELRLTGDAMKLYRSYHTVIGCCHLCSGITPIKHVIKLNAYHWFRHNHLSP